MSALFLLVLASADALLCLLRVPGVVAPSECSSDETAEDASEHTLTLALERNWPTAMSVGAFIAMLECGFNGSLPKLATPMAYRSAPRFTLGSAVESSHLPGRDIVLGSFSAVSDLFVNGSLPAHTRIGIVPLLYVDGLLPSALDWRPLERHCAEHRARYARRHDTLCTMAVGPEPSAPSAVSAAHIDCDWAVVYYGVSERHNWSLDRLRFFFHIPRALKTDLLVAMSGLVLDYKTVLFMDEDIEFRFNSTQWEAELMCVYGHIPIVWRPTFVPYSRTIWPWMNAGCFADDVRAVSLGNFSYLEPQIFFMRADFFLHYIDVFIAPVFVAHPERRSIWSLISAACFLAERAFPGAVSCALSRTLTAVHADMRTLSKKGTHGRDSMSVLQYSMLYFPDLRHMEVSMELIPNDLPCVTARPAVAGRFEPWPALRSNRDAAKMLSIRIKQRYNLHRQICIKQS